MVSPFILTLLSDTKAGHLTGFCLLAKGLIPPELTATHKLLLAHSTCQHSLLHPVVASIILRVGRQVNFNASQIPMCIHNEVVLLVSLRGASLVPERHPNSNYFLPRKTHSRTKIIFQKQCRRHSLHTLLPGWQKQLLMELSCFNVSN